jgi:hypothetical protein
MDAGNAFLEVHAGFDGAKDFATGAADAPRIARTSQPKAVTLVDRQHCSDRENSRPQGRAADHSDGSGRWLLNALVIPWQVVVHNQRASGEDSKSPRCLMKGGGPAGSRTRTRLMAKAHQMPAKKNK